MSETPPGCSMLQSRVNGSVGASGVAPVAIVPSMLPSPKQLTVIRTGPPPSAAGSATPCSSPNGDQFGPLPAASVQAASSGASAIGGGSAVTMTCQAV